MCARDVQGLDRVGPGLGFRVLNAVAFRLRACRGFGVVRDF